MTRPKDAVYSTKHINTPTERAKISTNGGKKKRGQRELTELKLKILGK